MPLMDRRLTIHLFLLAGSLPSPVDSPRGLSSCYDHDDEDSRATRHRVILLPQGSFHPSSPSTHCSPFLSPLEVQLAVETPLLFLEADSGLSAQEGPLFLEPSKTLQALQVPDAELAQPSEQPGQ